MGARQGLQKLLATFGMSDEQRRRGFYPWPLWPVRMRAPRPDRNEAIPGTMQYMIIWKFDNELQITLNESQTP